MLQKGHIQSILKINGITPDSSESEVREVLSGARYNEDEINAAVTMLKNGTEPSVSNLDGLHKVFRSSDGLKPNEISNLLSIDIGINDLNKPQTTKSSTDLNEPIVFTFATVIISAVGLIVAMYIYNIDILHIAQTAFGGV